MQDYKLIYLHGFLSAPISQKAQQTLQFMQQHFPSVEVHIPTLPGIPQQAIAMVDSIIEGVGTDNLRFIGSSMGGFLSTYFVEKYGGKACIVNPAVAPHRLLEGNLGSFENPNTGELFTLEQSHISYLQSIETKQLSQLTNYKVLLQEADETLDYRLAERKYAGADVCIEVGGDHSFQGFENHLPEITKFLFS